MVLTRISYARAVTMTHCTGDMGAGTIDTLTLWGDASLGLPVIVLYDTLTLI